MLLQVRHNTAYRCNRVVIRLFRDLCPPEVRTVESHRLLRNRARLQIITALSVMVMATAAHLQQREVINRGERISIQATKIYVALASTSNNYSKALIYSYWFSSEEYESTGCTLSGESLFSIHLLKLIQVNFLLQYLYFNKTFFASFQHSQCHQNHKDHVAAYS